MALSVLCVFLITVVIVICIDIIIAFYIRRIKLKLCTIQGGEEGKTSIQLKRNRKTDEMEIHLLRDQDDEQDNTTESVQEEFGTDSQINDAKEESRMSVQEMKRIIAQLQQEISRYQTDKRQLQQELVHYKMQCELLKQQYQLEKQQRHACQNELEVLRKQATNIQQEKHLQLLSETDSLREQKEQNDLTLQEKPGTESQITDAKEDSKVSPKDISKWQAELYKREFERTSAQLQQEVSGRQNDKRQLQQELTHYKKQCEIFNKQYQLEQLQRNASQNELENLRKENAQAGEAINLLQEKHLQALSERFSKCSAKRNRRAPVERKAGRS